MPSSSAEDMRRTSSSGNVSSLVELDQERVRKLARGELVDRLKRHVQHLGVELVSHQASDPGGAPAIGSGLTSLTTALTQGIPFANELTKGKPLPQRARRKPLDCQCYPLKLRRSTPMNIAVAIRLMPKTGDELEVDESGTDIDRELVEMVINEFDDQALEEAVLLKEATGATVTAVGLRSDGIDEALRLAYARGADRLVVVEAGEIDTYDSRTAALAFAEAFRQLEPDLVLTGVQTPTDVFGQTAPYLAANLGWPQASVVVGVTLADGTARVVQEYAGGRLAVLGLDLPAVVGVQSASSPPRYVAMARLRQAMTEASTETLNVSVDAPAVASKLVSLARPAPQTQATMLDGDAEEVAAKLVEVLRERGALSG